jgi:biopolymer transport protein ExbD
MAGGGGGEGEPEFQIAPMIDVLLVLLIFFMSITSAQVLKVDKSIELPISANALKKDSQRAEAIVNVKWDPATKTASYSMNERVYTEPSELSAALEAARKAAEGNRQRDAGPEFRCVIRGDREAEARNISVAMNAAAEAGITGICFSTVNRD